MLELYTYVFHFKRAPMNPLKKFYFSLLFRHSFTKKKNKKEQKETFDQRTQNLAHRGLVSHLLLSEPSLGFLEDGSNMYVCRYINI